METLLKRFQSFKPPTLAGTENAIECENWLEDIEQLFEALDYTDDRRLIVASAEEQENDIRIATEEDQQKLRSLFIVIHFQSGGSISYVNTQHDTWNSN
ncbi:hypothetical protein F511_38673 [Dorcoceras hygrometricum]|uniref:Uncharacterized protein n=1 Tax=Dorcoceras hygrometricum TaxID=472368 RepID=A0A2Z7CPN8_9LAMI|nr:hypothetical protein F511_38673 [Dorcoceras hygrometricum]